MEHDLSYYVRKKSSRVGMPIGERAKQFAPYAAVSGLGKVLSKVEEQWQKELAKKNAHPSDEEF